MIVNALRKGGMATLLLVLCLTARAQQPPLHQVQAVVDGLRSPEQAAYAQEHLHAVAGVRVARVDHNTRNLMLQVDPACGMNADDLGALLQPLGLGIRCFSRRPVGPGAFHHLDPRTCGQPPLETR
jgi:hypothetical protein